MAKAILAPAIGMGVALVASLALVGWRKLGADATQWYGRVDRHRRQHGQRRVDRHRRCEHGRLDRHRRRGRRDGARLHRQSDDQPHHELRLGGRRRRRHAERYLGDDGQLTGSIFGYVGKLTNDAGVMSKVSATIDKVNMDIVVERNRGGRGLRRRRDVVRYLRRHDQLDRGSVHAGWYRGRLHHHLPAADGVAGAAVEQGNLHGVELLQLPADSR